MRLPIADGSMRQLSPKHGVKLHNKHADASAERRPRGNGSTEIDRAEPFTTSQAHDMRLLHTAEAVSINLQQPSAELIVRYSTTIRVLRAPS
jgi:hypothetical protein